MNGGMRVDADITLGPCCLCTSNDAVVVIMLPQRAAIAGHGWGCVVCCLPADGATAVLCEPCFDSFRGDPGALTQCCAGYPAIDGRIAISDLPEGVFEHDPAKHRNDPGFDAGIVHEGSEVETVKKTFEEELDDLVADSLEDEDVDDIIAALESKLIELREANDT